MAEQATQFADSAAELERLTSDIGKVEALIATWEEESHQLTAQALKSGIDELHKEAFKRLDSRVEG